ncbi:aconitate hydratase [Pseudomonas aeruginosa]|nr:aconitate hydratase [Pseudomonas aeruginosa]
MPALDSLKTLRSLAVDGKTYHYYSLPEAARTLGDLGKLPMSLKVLLENLLRWEDGSTVTGDDLKALAGWLRERRSDREIQYRPARVLMQDFTGVPAVVDLAAMRAAMAKAGGDPQKINPLSPVDLVIDHSVMVDKFASESAFEQNVEIEMQRNGERYAFLRWGQNAFDNFSVVPPGTGICHQVNLEYLGRTVWTKDEDGRTYAFPDTLVGTDSHTTMINGLGVLGWGVGGIEAEAAMLGQPVSMLIPEVIGFKLTGKLREGITATDLVLTVTQMLRKKGVVGKFVEFYGDGLADLPLADRATIANMAPEYGATCGFFPVDEITLGYLRLSGRPESTVKLVEAYSKEQGLWREKGHEPVFTDTLHLDMGEVEASLAGPKRPQDRVALQNVASVLSGNRNFEGRVHPLVKTNWLASPPLVVAYALAGSVRINLSEEPLGTGKDGQPVYLKDIWPSQKEIAEAIQKVDTEMFHKEYAEVFAGDEKWQAIQVPQSDTYEWQADSTYIQHPPFFEHIAEAPPAIADVEQARVLAVLGDSVTTDHISPAGNIKADSPAGRYLREHGVEPKDFNSYGSRRGNHEVMMRGTFANIRIKNEMLGGEEGGNTLYVPSGEKLAIYDAAMRYQEDGTPLVIVAGKEYGTGSSRDWAAKGTNLLGVKAVIAESFERIHRSNLVGMGVLPLQFENGQDRKSLKLTGKEVLNIRGLGGELKPHMPLSVEVTREDGSQDSFKVLCRIDTLNEVEYFKAGGILHYVLRSML